MPINLVTGIAAILVVITITYLIRKDHLHVKYSVWWLLLTAPILVLGVFPEANDVVGAKLGISYPPILPVIVAILLLLIRSLTTDIELSKKSVRINRLVQRMAILEQELSDLKISGRDENT
ncbi:MAG: DUF2304 domain-containing protein [Pseudomonadales bacterium]|nr:DUF2304 domain-containing protein [Pseudomonadales bacterium]